jgi:hypothetical protein
MEPEAKSPKFFERPVILRLPCYDAHPGLITELTIVFYRKHYLEHPNE